MSDSSIAARTLFVTNVSPNVTAQNLKEFFTYCGKVESMQQKHDRSTNTPMYVIEMETIDGAKTGLMLDGTPLLGHNIQVSSPVFTKEDLPKPQPIQSTAPKPAPTPAAATTSPAPTTQTPPQLQQTITTPTITPAPGIPNTGVLPNPLLGQTPLMFNPYLQVAAGRGVPIVPTPGVNPLLGAVPYVAPGLAAPGVAAPAIPMMPFAGAGSVPKIIYPVTDKKKEEEIARTIYVGNINSQLSATQLIDFFSYCGPVSYVRMAGDEQQPTRFAFIEFLDAAGASAAMNLSGAILSDRPIKVNRSKNAIVKPPQKTTGDEARRIRDALASIARNIRRKERKDEDRSERGDKVERPDRDREHRRSRSPKRRRSRSRSPRDRDRNGKHYDDEKYHSRRHRSRDERSSSSKRHRSRSRDRDDERSHRSRSRSSRRSERGEEGAYEDGTRPGSPSASSVASASPQKRPRQEQDESSGPLGQQQEGQAPPVDTATGNA